MKSLALLLVMLTACSRGPAHGSQTDAPAGPDGDPLDGTGGSGDGLPAPIAAGDFSHALDKAYIRAPQTWIDDAGFETKWSMMLGTPIDFLGAADSAFHADLASRPVALPGGEVICHGDAKLDNFGWVQAGGSGEFSDLDFDDAGACPAAADILHYLLATDLLFGDPALDEVAVTAYVSTLTAASNATAIDPTGRPVWDDVRTKGVDKATAHKRLTLGGEVQVATSAEVAAVDALVASDARFATMVLDVARDVHVDGGSAGLRRFWVLLEDAQHPRTIIELKELAIPGTELGPHSVTYDDATRFDVLKPYWWGVAAPSDHFAVSLLGARFLARDRFTRTTPKSATMTAAQISNMVAAEASLLATKHRAAWAAFAPDAVAPWLRASAATLTARWRAAYTAAGGV